jgi:hypothetical protein
MGTSKERTRTRPRPRPRTLATLDKARVLHMQHVYALLTARGKIVDTQTFGSGGGGHCTEQQMEPSSLVQEGSDEQMEEEVGQHVFRQPRKADCLPISKHPYGTHTWCCCAMPWGGGLTHTALLARVGAAVLRQAMCSAQPTASPTSTMKRCRLSSVALSPSRDDPCVCARAWACDLTMCGMLLPV